MRAAGLYALVLVKLLKRAAMMLADGRVRAGLANNLHTRVGVPVDALTLQTVIIADIVMVLLLPLLGGHTLLLRHTPAP